MNRRAFVTGLGTVLVAPQFVGAQPSGRTYTIGYIHPGPIPTLSPPTRNAFSQTLSEFGFVVGQNVVEERRGASGHTEKLPELAAELVRLNVDVIVTIGNLATHATRRATRAIPIVMAYVSDPEDDGLITNRARPGSNVTGVIAADGIDFGTKILDLVKELLPRASRVAIIANRESSNSRRNVGRLQDIVKGLELIYVEVGDGDDLVKSFDTIQARRPDAMWLWTTAITAVDHPRIVQLALRHRVPSIIGSRRAVEAGALLSYNEDHAVVWRRIGRYVGRILRGAKPADLPVEQPTQFELAINLKTAKVLGLTVPPSLLLRADHVIQ